MQVEAINAIARLIVVTVLINVLPAVHVLAFNILTLYAGFAWLRDNILLCMKVSTFT
jgi:hypothetical protein